LLAYPELEDALLGALASPPEPPPHWPAPPPAPPAAPAPMAGPLLLPPAPPAEQAEYTHLRASLTRMEQKSADSIASRSWYIAQIRRAATRLQALSQQYHFAVS